MHIGSSIPFLHVGSALDIAMWFRSGPGGREERGRQSAGGAGRPGPASSSRRRRSERQPKRSTRLAKNGSICRSRRRSKPEAHEKQARTRWLDWLQPPPKKLKSQPGDDGCSLCLGCQQAKGPSCVFSAVLAGKPPETEETSRAPARLSTAPHLSLTRSNTAQACVAGKPFCFSPSLPSWPRLARPINKPALNRSGAAPNGHAT